MNLKNFLLGTSKLFLLLGFFSLNSQLLSENRKNCPRDFPTVGTKFVFLGKNKFKLTITKKKFLKDAANNESLAEHIALLKLEAVEDYQKWIRTDISNEPTKYGGYKYTSKFDNSWKTMKLSLASMEELGTCIEKDRILFSGVWTSKSIERAKRIIALKEVFDELYMLELEDPKFKIEKLIKKYPTILDNKDPEVLRKVIYNWRKNRKF